MPPPTTISPLTEITTPLRSQFLAALRMLEDCLRRCPDDHWDAPVAAYPFWQVAYHTLCFTDLYLTPGGHPAFSPRPDLHPAGWREFDDEFPSRRFSRDELLAYTALLLHHAAAALDAETPTTLAAPANHPRRTFSRLELHLYNLRHLMHHTGQLSATARRAGAEPKWISTGAP